MGRGESQAMDLAGKDNNPQVTEPGSAQNPMMRFISFTVSESSTAPDGSWSAVDAGTRCAQYWRMLGGDRDDCPLSFSRQGCQCRSVSDRLPVWHVIASSRLAKYGQPLMLYSLI